MIFDTQYVKQSHLVEGNKLSALDFTVLDFCKLLKYNFCNDMI